MSENNIVRAANGILASLVFSLKPVYTGNSFTDAATDVVCTRLRKKFDFAQLPRLSPNIDYYFSGLAVGYFAY